MKSLIQGKNSEAGFVALVSTLVISGMLVTLMYSTSAGSFYSRLDSLGSEYKRISLGLSESCTNAALLKIAQNYNYSITSDPEYDASKGGVPYPIGDDECIIKSVTFSNPITVAGQELKKTAVIQTSAQFPLTAGSWSVNQIKATLQNPAFQSIPTPPSCNTFSITPTGEINAGQSVTLNWNISGADSFYINRITSSTTPMGSGLPFVGTLVDTPTESATYVGIASTTAGAITQCTAVSISVKPNVGECADTVMMLDRTGSMSSSDLADEKTAANGLLDLYDNLTPLPKASIGVFGAIGANEPYNANIIQGLTTVYTNLYNAVTTGLASAGGFTNLASAINTSDTELNSAGHTNGSKKVMILVSDGGANRPCPPANPNCGSGVNTTATNAATTAANNAKAPHGSDNLPTKIFTIHFGNAGNNYSDMNYLATLATDSSNNHLITTDTGFLSPTSDDGNHDDWSFGQRATSSDNQYATETAEDEDQSFENFGFNIPSSSTINGIEVRIEAKHTDPVGCQAEVRMWSDSDNEHTNYMFQGVTSTDAVYTLGSPTNLWGSTWIASDFDNSDFHLEIRYDDATTGSCSAGTMSLDHIEAKVFYSSVDAVAENADGDHFFIAPDSDDMDEVFDTVAKLACPALSTPGGPAPIPPSPPNPPPPSPILIGSWDEVIDISP